MIEHVIHELTQISQQITTLETTAEEHRREAENLRESEMMNRKIIEQLEEQLVHEKKKSEALSMEFERMTTQRNRLQVEIKDLQDSTVKQIALRDVERDKMREDFERKLTVREEAVDRFKKSFTEIQDLMNSVQAITGYQTSQVK